MKTHTYRGADVTFGEIANRGGSGAPDCKSLHGLVDFCIDNVKPEHTVLELGTFQCASTSIFIQFAKKVMTVDVNSPKDDFADAIDKSAENYGSEVHFYQCSSLDFVDFYVNEHENNLNYDVLYIDTVHTEAHCTKELESFVPFCNSSPKIIAGHDYPMKGIESALNKFFKREPDNVYEDGTWVYHH